jgi:dolichyl-phosphate-mannose-protein mannosyltransferase
MRKRLARLRSHRVFAVFLAAYAVAFLLVLPDYGITWDAYAEYPRAAAYVEKLVSGRSSPEEVPPDERIPWGVLTYAEAKASNTKSANGCLPSLVAALTGKLLYQRLGLLGPIDAYHAGLALLWLGGLVLFYLRVAELASRRVAILAAAMLALSPRLFADAHNNMKDVPSSMFGWLAVLEWLTAWMLRRPGRLWSAALLFGASLASKQTSLVLLAPLVAGALIAVLLRGARPTRRELLAAAAFPLVAGAIALGHLPHLWVEPAEALRRLEAILEIGLRQKIREPRWTSGVVLLAAVTTPPLILAGFLAGVGEVASRFRRFPARRKALWLTSAVAFVSVLALWSAGRLKVFDGIRNFEHFVPPLCVLAALGWVALERLVERSVPGARAWVQPAGALALLVSLVVPCVAYHPHQIAYFNFLVGGIRGAQAIETKESSGPVVIEAVDYWGSSLRRCVDWGNQHLPRNARVTVGTPHAVGQFYELRADLRRTCAGCDPERDEHYVLLVHRPLWYEPCDRYAVENGTPLHVESALGVPMASVLRIPSRLSPCHDPPVLELLEKSVSRSAPAAVRLRVHGATCVARRPVQILIGSHKELPGAKSSYAFEGRVWTDFENLPRGSEPSAVLTLGEDGIGEFALSPEALSIAEQEAGWTFTIVVAIPPSNFGLASNSVELAVVP